MSDCCTQPNKIEFSVSGVSNACAQDIYVTEVTIENGILEICRNDGVCFSAPLPVDEDIYITNFERVGDTLILTRSDGETWAIDDPDLFVTDNALSLNGNTLTSTITRSDGSTFESSVELPVPDCSMTVGPEQECYSQEDGIAQVGNGGCVYKSPAPNGNAPEAGNTDVHIDCDGLITVQVDDPCDACCNVAGYSDVSINGGVCVNASNLGFDNNVVIFESRSESVIRGSADIITSTNGVIQRTYQNNTSCPQRVTFLMSANAQTSATAATLTGDIEENFIFHLGEDLNAPYPARTGGGSAMNTPTSVQVTMPRTPSTTTEDQGDFTNLTNKNASTPIMRYTTIVNGGDSVTVYGYWWWIITDVFGTVPVYNSTAHGDMALDYQADKGGYVI